MKKRRRGGGERERVKRKKRRKNLCEDLLVDFVSEIRMRARSIRNEHTKGIYRGGSPLSSMNLCLAVMHSDRFVNQFMLSALQTNQLKIFILHASYPIHRPNTHCFAYRTVNLAHLNAIPGIIQIRLYYTETNTDTHTHIHTEAFGEMSDDPIPGRKDTKIN